jgi:hypothetical protein
MRQGPATFRPVFRTFAAGIPTVVGIAVYSPSSVFPKSFGGVLNMTVHEVVQLPFFYFENFQSGVSIRDGGPSRVVRILYPCSHPVFCDFTH